MFLAIVCFEEGKAVLRKGRDLDNTAELSRRESSEFKVAMEKARKFRVAKKVYCLCRQEEKGFMVECSSCQEWYHGPCVSVTQTVAKNLVDYYCPHCKGYRKEYEELLKRIQALEAKWSSLHPNEAQGINMSQAAMTEKQQTCASAFVKERDTELQNLKKEIVRLQETLGSRDAELQVLSEGNNMLKQELDDLKLTFHAKEKELRTVIEEKDLVIKQMKKRSRLSLSQRSLGN